MQTSDIALQSLAEWVVANVGRYPHLAHLKNAQFINRVVPGACIPESIISRLENSPNPIDEGILIAAEQVKSFLGIAQGVHLMAVKAEQQIPQILDRANVS